MVKNLCLALITLGIGSLASAEPAAQYSGKQGEAPSLNGLPVLSHRVSAGRSKRRKSNYYFEDRHGNLHLVRMKGNNTPLPRHDRTFRKHPIYDKPPQTNLAPGHWRVYYYRNANGDLTRMMISSPPQKGRDVHAVPKEAPARKEEPLPAPMAPKTAAEKAFKTVTQKKSQNAQ